MSTSISASPETTGEGQRPRRRRLPWSIVLAGLVILGAVAYLIYANTQSNAAYDMTVSQLKQCSACVSQAVRVEGTVQKGSIQRDDATQRLAFVISDGQQSLSVVYNGVVPDIFNAGIQVVVEGHYSGQHSAFQAQTLLTKCPSKFTAATPTP
ncbi:MAG TPA: cytochrome c maturation protein CcmE [Ktedonobacteraceae bacterium]